MAKITRWGGPSYDPCGPVIPLGMPGVPTVFIDAVPPEGDEEPAWDGKRSEPSSANEDGSVKTPSKPNRSSARTTAKRSAPATTGARTAHSTGGVPTAK